MNITVEQLIALMEKWNTEKLEQCRGGQIIDINTGELTGLEWVSVRNSSRTYSDRKPTVGFYGTYPQIATS